MIEIKNKQAIEGMRAAGKLAAEVLHMIDPWVQPGVTTERLNQLCHDFIKDHGAIPAPLNYHGFPKSICTSVNEVVCHGIPSEKMKLADGDIINVDVTVILDGFHGDTSCMYGVGTISKTASKLIDATRRALYVGIDQVKPNARVGNIGHAIQSLVEPMGYGVVRDYTGHGIGRNFHEEPQILHYGKKDTGTRMKAGMTFTVEPMINLGTWEVDVLSDDWTAVTADGKLSAQFEHTILVTEKGAEILTASKLF